MKRLVVSLAAIMLLSILAVGIAAAATTPGTPETVTDVSGTRTEVVAAGKNALTVEPISTFGQHGFCDQDDYASPASY